MRKLLTDYFQQKLTFVKSNLDNMSNKLTRKKVNKEQEFKKLTKEN